MADRRAIDRPKRREEHEARVKAYQSLTKEEKIAQLPKGEKWTFMGVTIYPASARQLKRLGVKDAS